jgi:hypothetical protein
MKNRLGALGLQAVVFFTNFVYGTPEKACLPSAASRSLSLLFRGQTRRN